MERARRLPAYDDRAELRAAGPACPRSRPACGSLARPQDRLLSALPTARSVAGFNRERMQAGHQNWFLDPQLAGPLPRWRALDPLLSRWHYGRLRFVPRPLLERVRASGRRSRSRTSRCTPSFRSSSAGRRFGLPVVGHVASWDHTVGKGIVSPHLRRYIVQNDVMRDDLVRYHGIEPDASSSPAGRRPTSSIAAGRGRSTSRSCAGLGARSRTARRPRHGEHADQRAVRDPLRRAARRLVGRERRRSTLLAALSPASARP